MRLEFITVTTDHRYRDDRSRMPDAGDNLILRLARRRIKMRARYTIFLLSTLPHSIACDSADRLPIDTFSLDLRPIVVAIDRLR